MYTLSNISQPHQDVIIDNSIVLQAKCSQISLKYRYHLYGIVRSKQTVNRHRCTMIYKENTIPITVPNDIYVNQNAHA